MMAFASVVCTRERVTWLGNESVPMWALLKLGAMVAEAIERFMLQRDKKKEYCGGGRKA